MELPAGTAPIHRVAIFSGAAVEDGIDHLEVCIGKVRVLLHVVGAVDPEDFSDGCHSYSSCIRVSIRA